MKGTIIGLSGPTVTASVKGLKLYERVSVGQERLAGEVVRLEKDRAVIQVYEDTRGLGIGEMVSGTGAAFQVRLGPGLLSVLFDGLQRPLKRLEEKTGPFVTRGAEISGLDQNRRWRFFSLKKDGETVAPGEIMGYVIENDFKHYIAFHDGREGRISWIRHDDFCLDEPVAQLEDGREIFGYREWPVRIPMPYQKKRSPSEPLITGQRSIDFLFPFGKGGTAIMPGGFGTGKTILEQSIAKYAEADIVVYVGCGERGNEMAEMIEEFDLLDDAWTKRKLMDRTILVVNTSNMPVSAREASIYTAVSMAEYYRDMGYHVLFLADSISRWAEALREISSSLEEMPGEEGYPTYLSSRLSGFLERAGVVETTHGQIGSLSMIISVSPPGGDFTEPVTQSCMRTSGTFLMLDTALAHRRQFPAVNWLQSYSLYEQDITGYYCDKIDPAWDDLKKRCKEILEREETLREVVEVIGVEGLQDDDRLVMIAAERIRMEFLCQNAYTEDAFSRPEQTLSLLSGILDFFDTAAAGLREGKPLDDMLSEKEHLPGEDT
jgi:V/A-type H+-transporting ATPase subunit A